ncbi:MAG: maleylpyruvate isomerase N-terminal domain-containing protein [Candidatus Nanopelagicales bacterium]
MAEPHPLPPGLEPDQHEHGLASGELRALAADIDRAWELFESVAASADLSAPSRKEGWTARELVARLGQWEFGRTLEHMLADAHDGDADRYDADAVDEQVRLATADLPDEDILAALAAARATTADWLSSDGPATWGLVHTSSPLGPLPILTVMNAMTYQLSIAALDLEPAEVMAPEDLLGIGLNALIDATGALAGRKHVTGSFTAVTPERVVGSGARGGHWRTAILESDPHSGPAVVAPTRVIIDATSGRGNVTHFYRTGVLQVRDLTGLVRLAPVLEGVPGVPPMGAIGTALSVVDAVGGLFGRLRR